MKLHFIMQLSHMGSINVKALRSFYLQAGRNTIYLGVNQINMVSSAA